MRPVLRDFRKRLTKRRWLKPALLSLCALLVAVLAAAVFRSPATPSFTLSAGGRAVFARRSILSDVEQLFDLGVVDINADGNLDIYTSNHSAGQFLLLGDSSGGFSGNKLSEFFLDQDLEFPGLEDFGTAPVIEAPGFYIYWQGRDLVLQTHRLAENGPVAGKFSFSAPVEAINQNRNFDLDVQTATVSPEATVSTIQFTAEENAQLLIRPFNVSIPITFQMAAGLPPNQIYIGNAKVNPAASDFSLYLRDRHGMAWSDYNSDGRLDVFIVRGGLRARMNDLPGRYTDELLIRQANGRYQNEAEALGLVKAGCPALQPAWVDFNSDQRLDLYVGCFTPLRATQSFPNQLHHQQPDGTFVNVAAEVNLDIPESGAFTWLDADLDGDADLFWVDAEALWLYRNEAGRFTAERIGENPGGISKDFSSGYNLSSADYDRDGDIDLFFASATGNVLIESQEGFFEARSPGDKGLPATSFSANWVDFDNDGLTDLHAIPSGLYQQQADHSFRQTALLQGDGKRLSSAMGTWFDSDGDGDRDLLMATQYREPKVQEVFKKVVRKFTQKEFASTGSQVSLYENLLLEGHPANDEQAHWLQIDLVGPPNNRQAIGARVEVTDSAGTQLQIVGQSEGSHYSQGHYRLYFGLGRAAQSDRIKVTWADSSVQTLEEIDSNQRLTVEYSPQRGSP
ncbi:MAG: CRTAC1 family protein [Phormidesmis sp.]